MIRLSRDSWWAIGLFVLLGVVTAVAIIQESRSNVAVPPLANFSTQPNGANALSQWLTKLGYSTSDEVDLLFTIPDDTDLLFMLEPYFGIQESEWETIDAWVEAGGTLLLAGNEYGAYQAFRHYEFTLRFENEETLVTVETPLFDAPALTAPEELNGRSFFTTDRSDFTTHVAVNGRPAIVTIPQGEGQIILSSLIRPFTNQGLKEAQHPELLLNLLNGSGKSGRVWFDEYHHGIRPEKDLLTANNWLQRTPAGRAILYSLTIIFIGLLLQGRIFGRPVPLPKDITRRAPLEYITAIANLSRRAGHRTAVMQDNHHRLKQHLGQRYRLSPTLPDSQFVQKLATYNPNLDAKALHTLLRRLAQTEITESDMVNLAAETAKWLDQ